MGDDQSRKASGTTDDKAKELQQSLRTAVEALITHTDSDGFFAEFTTEGGKLFYLAFGDLRTLIGFIAARSEATQHTGSAIH